MRPERQRDGAPLAARPLPLPPRAHRLAERLYHAALWLYPRRFRRRFGTDLTAVFVDLVAEARMRRGTPGALAAVAKGLADVTVTAARERLARLGPAPTTARSASRGELQMLDHMSQDIRLSLRTLRKAPGYAAAAILTLALGIGAISAIFSVGSAAMLQSAPVQAPHELVAVWTTCRAGNPRCSSSYPDYLDYRDRAALIEDLTAYTYTTASLGRDDGARLVSVQAAAGNYFRLLGVVAATGRVFTPEDEAQRRLVTVLSAGFWRDQFGADPDVVGSTIRLNRVSFEVVGVTPDGFDGLHLGGGPDLFIPLRSGPALDSGFLDDEERFTTRNSRWIAQLIGRLAPDATVEQARAELLAISDQLALEDPDARGPRRVTVESAERLIPPTGDEGELGDFVLLLSGVVGFTLLLACANLANLLLARAAGRRREIGVRLALGAGRARIVRQLLTESCVLALLGGGAGLLVGYGLMSLLRGYELPGGVDIGRIGATLDPSVLAFTAGLSLLTGLVFGLAPALQATRVALDAGMRASSRGVIGGSTVARRALVAVQVALCLVLLTGSGLFLQALWTGLDTDLGFPVEGLAVAAVDLGVLQYSPEQGEALVDSLGRRLEALPGVTAVGVGTRAPMLPGGTATLLQGVEGYQLADDEELRVEYAFVDEGYLRALGLPLLQGGPVPAEAPPGRRVMVINRDMAERWWPGRPAVGGRVTFFGENAPQGEVVGVAGNTKWDDGIAIADYPFAYMPLSSSGSWVNGGIAVLVRTDGDAAALLPLLRDELVATERDASIVTLATMETLLRDVLMPQRMGAWLLSCFAALALLLAAVGIYSMMAYQVSQRRRDIGVRIALGASRGDIMTLVLTGIALPLVVGIVVGLGVSRLLADLVAGFLYGISPTDPWTAAAVVVGLVAIAVGASLVPARRAARVEPTVALRAD